MVSLPTSPILTRLATLLAERGDEVQHWLDEQWAGKLPFIYTSVDLRHSGYKLAPVDTNLYPAGFNNLSELACHRAVAEFRHYFRSMSPVPARVLIIPENHTRNLGYLENLHVLSGLLTKAGVEVRIGSLTAEEPLALTSLSGAMVTELPLVRKGNRVLTSDGFDADAIVLNNDFTAGAHALLESIEQPQLPPMVMGWYNRRKSEHFGKFCKLARQFGEAFDFDCWLLSPHFKRVGVVDFSDKHSMEKLAQTVDEVLGRIRESYASHGVSGEPYVYVKADSGTYGMGIMTARSGAELLELNKKTRNKMNVIKEGTKNTEVIVQEGVPTVDVLDGAPAEPMVYLVGGSPVGGAYRVNRERDATSNLNAAGMSFVGMCDEAEPGDDKVKVPECNFGAFGLVARLAAIAATRENYSDFEYTI